MPRPEDDLENILGGARPVTLSEIDKQILRHAAAFKFFGAPAITEIAGQLDLPMVLSSARPRIGSPKFRATTEAARDAERHVQARRDIEENPDIFGGPGEIDGPFDEGGFLNPFSLVKSVLLGGINTFLGPISTPLNVGRVVVEEILLDDDEEATAPARGSDARERSLSAIGGADVSGSGRPGDDVLLGDERADNLGGGPVQRERPIDDAARLRADDAAAAASDTSGRSAQLGGSGFDRGFGERGQSGRGEVGGNLGGSGRGGIDREEGGMIPESTVPGVARAPVPNVTLHENEMVLRSRVPEVHGAETLEELNRNPEAFEIRRRGGGGTLAGGSSSDPLDPPASPSAPIVVNVGGAQIRLPAGATPEAIQGAIAHFQATPEFDALIDKTSGAPARVRMLVGSAPSQDRLANLHRFYPDAMPYDDDNFVFTDPVTGRPTLYNPEGLDVGDVASVAREGAQFVGSTLGALAGAAAGTVFGAPTGPGVFATASTTAATAAGLGAAAGGSLFDALMGVAVGRIDTRPLARITIDTATDVMAAASGQRMGELMPLAFKRALGAGRSGAQALIDTFKRLSIDPPAGAATGSGALGTVEKMLAGTPSSGAIMQENAERVLAQTKAAADDLAARFGRPLDRGPAGETVRRGAQRAADVFEAKQEQIYIEAFDMIGDDTLVSLTNVTALRRELQQRLGAAPESLRRTLGAAINRLQAMEADALANVDDVTRAALDAGEIGADEAMGGIAFGALRQIRTDLGRELAAPVMVGSVSARNDALKQVYGALTQDLSEAARQTGPEAAKKLAAADRFTRLFMNTSAKTLEKIGRFDADEKAFDYVMSMTKDGAQSLARMRRHFEPDEWDSVAATVLSRMGLARPYAQDASGDVFSVSTFLTNWNRMTPEAKKTLFGGRRYADMADALDDLTTAVSSLKDMERLANTSKTAPVMIAWMTMQTLIGGLAGFGATGDVGTGALSAVGTVIAPRAAARLITNPRFVQWLASPVTNPTGISAHLGRLTEIALAEPEIEGEIDQYLAVLRDVMGTQPEPAFTGAIE